MDVETNNIDIELSDFKIGDELHFSDYFWDGIITHKSEYKKGYSKIAKIYKEETVVDGVIDTYFHQSVFALLENDIVLHLGFIIDGVFKNKEENHN